MYGADAEECDNISQKPPIGIDDAEVDGAHSI